jgi:DNA-binding transcriptional ArsR family regulator
LAINHELIQTLQVDMDPALLDELPIVFGKEHPGTDTPLPLLGQLAGVLQEADYSTATLAMRQLTLAEAIEALSAARMGVSTRTAVGKADADALEQLTAGLEAFTQSAYASLGLESTHAETLRRRTRAQAAHLVRILPGGDLHARFWHWQDRFYYECYAPWRAGREPFMQAQEARAVQALGGREGVTMPSLEWLAPQNSLRSRTGVRGAVTEGRFSVFFQVEPFGLIDLLTVDADWLYVTFGGPGFQYELFRQASDDLALRAKALADPTRLIILRLIRNFAMDNTEMAEFLQIARPTVSVHAKILREAGLINTRQVGRQARHEINADAVRALFSKLTHFLDLPAADDEAGR